MSRIMYSANGGGRWWRTEWAPQCEEKILLGSQCQGTAGHLGVHWCYSPSGDFIWDDNDDDPQEDAACGSTPPGHSTYKSPSEMRGQYHLNFKVVAEVTDPEILTRLEADDPPEGMENCSINKPLSKDDPFYEEAQRRLKDHECRKKPE